MLPCPSVAVCAPGPDASADGLLAAFDVTVDDDAQLAEVVAGISAAPLASMALVGLLREPRAGDIGAVHRGLVAESLVYSTLQSGPEFAAWLRSHQPRTVAAEDGPAVAAIRDGGDLVLELNRPATRNAFSVEMRDALCEALELVLVDDSIERVVVRGRGPSFCSGGDLREFGTFPDPATAHVVRCTRNAGRLLSMIAGRVRFEVHGACIGAGIELPAFAGRVVAARDAYFQLPELSMGLVPGAGGTTSIPRRIGRQRTALMAITARAIDAETALAWGLVDELL